MGNDINNEQIFKKITLQMIREKAMKLDADQLTALEIFELGSILEKLQHLEMAEIVQVYERQALLEKLNRLEKKRRK